LLCGYLRLSVAIIKQQCACWVLNIWQPSSADFEPISPGSERPNEIGSYMRRTQYRRYHRELSKQ